MGYIGVYSSSVSCGGRGRGSGGFKDRIGKRSIPETSDGYG